MSQQQASSMFSQSRWSLLVSPSQLSMLEQQAISTQFLLLKLKILTEITVWVNTVGTTVSINSMILPSVMALQLPVPNQNIHTTSLIPTTKDLKLPSKPTMSHPSQAPILRLTKLISIKQISMKNKIKKDPQGQEGWMNATVFQLPNVHLTRLLEKPQNKKIIQAWSTPVSKMLFLTTSSSWYMVYHVLYT